MGYRNDTIKQKSGTLVTLEQAKEQLNVDSDFTRDDNLISRLIEDAIGIVEIETGREIAYTHNTKEFIDFSGGILTIEEAPIIQVDSVVVVDSEGTSTLVEGTDYTVQKRRIDFSIIFEEYVEYDSMTVTFKTGYTTVTLPKALRSAILVKVNDLYDLERGSITFGTNFKNNHVFERLIEGFIINRW